MRGYRNDWGFAVLVERQLKKEQVYMVSQPVFLIAWLVEQQILHAVIVMDSQKHAL